MLTLSNGHATTISDDLDAINIPHKYYWKTLEGYSPLLDAATSRGVQSRALRQRDRYASRDLPYRATARAQRDTWTHQYGHGNSFVYQYNGILSFEFHPLPIRQTLTVPFTYPFVFEGECWISYSVFGSYCLHKHGYIAPFLP